MQPRRNAGDGAMTSWATALPASPEFPLPGPRRNNTPFNARKLLALLISKIHILICASLVGVLFAVVATQTLPQSFTSSAMLLIDPKRPGSYGAEAAFANVFVDSAKIASVEVILASSALLERVVDAEHLADLPEFGDAHISPFRRLAARLYLMPQPTIVNTPAARRLRAVYHLSRMIHTSRIGMTYAIRIDVRSDIPDQARRLAKAVSDAYLADQMETKSANARSDGAWLASRVQALRRDLLESEASVEQIREKFHLTETDSGPGSTVDRQAVTETNAELNRAEADLAAAQARDDQAQSTLRTGGRLDGLSAVTTSKLIEGLRQQQADANRRVAALATIYTPTYPERLQAERDRNILNEQIDREVSRIVAGIHLDYETALARRNALMAQLAREVGAVNATSRADGRVQLSEAKRLAEANRVAYQEALSRQRDVEEQVTRQDAEARIISEPQTPDAPSFPKPSYFLPAGATLGLLTGMALVLLAPRLRNHIADADRAEAMLSLPVLAMTPLLHTSDLMLGTTRLSIPEYAALAPYTQFSESLRLLRLGLRAPGANATQVIQLTSAVIGEGKSTLAASLAISAATAGVHTVIVDLDFHSHAIAQLFQCDDAPGVTDVLLSNVTAETALRRHATLPLSIFTAGSAVDRNPHLIESTGLRGLVDELKTEFDLVILDTPPVLAIADPIIIADLADMTIMVAAWRDTPSDTVNYAVNLLRAAHVPLGGMVLNKVESAHFLRHVGSSYTYRKKLGLHAS